MAVKFKVVKRKVLNGAEKDSVKNYAIAKTSGTSDLNKLCKLICSRSTLSSADVKAVLKDAYGGSIVRYTETADADGFLSAAALTGKDAMEIAVFGNEARILLTARYDNLGKGASGAAVECMNLVLGVDPATGLNL